MPAAYLPDGYTAKGYLAEVPRLYDALRFEYRPCPVDEGSEFLEAGYKLTPKQADARTAQFLSDHLVSWDLTGTDGQLLPIAPSTFLKGLFNRVVFKRLAQIVLDRGHLDSRLPQPGHHRVFVLRHPVQAVERQLHALADVAPV